MKITQFLFFSISISITLCCCSPVSKGQVNKAATITVYPFTDSNNTGKWKLNTDISDEFEAPKLDEAKWLIQGRNGVYQSNSIGRAPSQYSPDNVRVENGKLKLSVKYEPNFNFSKKLQKGNAFKDFTAAALISKKQFLYGYMEIKCKASDASVSSSFWGTGLNTELDVFEFFGKPKLASKKILETTYWCSIHDWGQSGGPSVWTDRIQLPYRVADNFHVYACEWDPNYLKFYADGVLIKSATKAEIGAGWVVTNPISIWVNSVCWYWNGLPDPQDLPVDYEIEYIRIWQK